MKNRILSLSTILLSILLVSLTSCESDLFNFEKITPGEGISDVKIGDSEADVKKALGDNTMQNWGFDGTTCTNGSCTSITATFHYMDYEDLGIDINFYGEGITVSSITVYAPYDGKTPEGIKIGSTKEEVEKEYGTGIKEYSFYEYSSLGIDFKYEEDIVVEIRVYD